MDVLKKAAFVLGLAVFGAGLSACNKSPDAGSSAGPSATTPGYGSSSGSSSSSSSGG